MTRRFDLVEQVSSTHFSVKTGRESQLGALLSTVFIGMISAGHALGSESPLSESRDSLPLTIQALTTDRGEWVGTVGLATSQRFGVDQYLVSTNVAWGLSSRFQLAFNSSHSEMPDAALPATRRYGVDSRFLINREGRYPGFQVSAGVDTSDGALEANQYRIGAAVWKSIDPVVLSLTASVERTDFGSSVPGANTVNTWSLQPIVNFAVNPWVTLTTGWTLRKDQTLEHGGVWGLAVAASPNAQFFFDYQQTSGPYGASRFDLRYRHIFN